MVVELQRWWGSWWNGIVLYISPISFLSFSLSCFSALTHSASHILLKVPKAHTSMGLSSFQFAAASDWNKLQQTLKLDSFISISSFKEGHSYWQLRLLCVMYCCLYLLALCAVGCAQWCLYHVFVLLPCCVATMLLWCCVATMLYSHVLLPCYVVVSGLSLCSVVLSFLLWRVFCPTVILFLFFIFNPSPCPHRRPFAFW